MREKDLQNELLLALGPLPHVRVWRNNVGVAKPLDRDCTVTYGRKGMSDVFGIVRTASGVGAFLSIECKSAAGKKPTPEQLSWLRMVDAFGGLALVAKNLTNDEEAIDAEVRRIVNLVGSWILTR